MANCLINVFAMFVKTNSYKATKYLAAWLSFISNQFKNNSNKIIEIMG